MGLEAGTARQLIISVTSQEHEVHCETTAISNKIIIAVYLRVQLPLSAACEVYH